MNILQRRIFIFQMLPFFTSDHDLHDHDLLLHLLPLMPLLNHGYFLPGSMDSGFKSWSPEGPLLRHHLLQSYALKPLPSILGPKSITFMDRWRYNQLNRFILSLPHPLRVLQDLNPIESMFIHKNPPLHRVSQFYTALTTLQGPL